METLEKNTSKTKEKLILIGNGMVGCQFCVEFLDQKLSEKYELTVFGKEAKVAYDRIRLTDYAREQDLDKITLKPSAWYKENDIDLHVNEAVTEIDTKKKELKTSKDKTYKFDKLVFATGSNPFVPPVEGKDNEGVFVYRTYDDVDQIIEYSKKCREALVVGGGLLGLEAANFLKDIGLNTHVVEQASYLMPRQLDMKGAEVFKQTIEAKGYNLHLGVSIKKITQADNNSLEVHLGNGKTISTDIVVFSAGVRSNSMLAEESGIICSPSKGIIVDDSLETSSKDIYAIGECVKHRGELYGLVAPGYNMAKTLATRLTGGDALFKGADMSTRLKMLGEDVISLGDPLQPLKSLEYQAKGVYRKIIHQDGELVGAIGIGEWLQAGQIQTAIQNRMPINKEEQRRFVKTGALWKERQDIRVWPDEAIICNCMKVTKGELVSCMAGGCETVECLKKETGASTVCGSCTPMLESLCGKASVEPKRPEYTLLITSFLTLAAVAIVVFMPTIWGGESYESDQWQRTAFLQDRDFRQITGFTMLGLTVLAGLISVRKRIRKISFVKFSIWRILHGLFGLTSIIVLMFHTGFSAGQNLNFMLFTSFTLINFLGFLTGMASAFEYFGLTKVEAFCRKWRQQITFLHILAFWPLPVLLTFHIIQAYYFGG